MSVLLRLLPWIAYFAGSFLLDPKWAAPLAAVAAVIVIVYTLATGGRPAECILDGATAVYFVGFSALVWLAPNAPAGRFVAAGSQLWLALVVGGFLLAGLPFTQPLSRREAPREVWDFPPFKQLNVRVTTTWLVAFVVSGIVLLGAALLGYNGWVVPAVAITAAIVIPVVLQRRLIEAFRRKYDPDAADAAGDAVASPAH